MINYLNRYSALSAHLTAPLSALTHQAVDYKPGKVHFENFNGLKLEISNMELPEHEQNCLNLEKEALGTIFGMEKFHYFLYGKEFTLETNQKPLVSIYKKHMIDISPMVQRLIVRSCPYLPFKVVYKKGIDIPVADALIRVTPMDPEDNIKLPIIAVNMITTQILMSVESQGSFSSKLE